MTPKNQNSNHEEIKSELFGVFAVLPVQNLCLFARIKMHRNIVSLVVSMVAKLGLSHISGRAWTLRVLENRVLWGTVGLKRDESWETGVNCVMRGFIICTAYQMLLAWPS
jgi:hypothetical protein